MWRRAKAGMVPPLFLIAAWPCAASGKAGTMETKGESKSESKATAGAGLRLDRFEPAAGAPGDPVLVTGAGLVGTTKVSFGRAPAPSFHVVDDSRLYVLVPPGASGRIGVDAGKSRARFAAGFTVRHYPPTLIQVSPQHGPPGTEVLLVGTSFTPDLKVAIGGTEAHVTVRSLTQAVMVVPKDSKGGDVTLATVAGKAKGSEPFRITEPKTGLHLEVTAVMLTQGSQTPDTKVPLVAGRDGFLAITVLADRPNHEAPVVRVHLRSESGEEVLTRDIPAPTAGVPLYMDPSNISAQWTLPIDGKYLNPGTDLRLEVLPEGSKDSAAKALYTWPPYNWSYLRVKRVPPIEIFLIPVIQDGLTPVLEDATRRLEDWTAFFRAIYPVAEVKVTRGEPLHCTGTLKPDDFKGWSTMADQVEARRIQDGRSFTQFYYGIVRTRYAHGLYGWGLEGHPSSNKGRSAIGTDSAIAYPGGPPLYQQVLAHELGHVFNLLHAPATLPDMPLEGVDQYYPYPGADIGSFGFDLAGRTLKAPSIFKDIMSYCPPFWISDHNYQHAFMWLEDQIGR